MNYVKFQTPEEVKKRILELARVAKETGKVRKGVNEVTKAIERGIAKIVVIAEDVNPPEIVMHLPSLSEEKNIPYAYVSTKEELGKSVGLKVGTSSIAIVDPGSGNELLGDIVKRLPKPSEGKEEKVEKTE